MMSARYSCREWCRIPGISVSTPLTTPLARIVTIMVLWEIVKSFRDESDVWPDILDSDLSSSNPCARGMACRARSRASSTSWVFVILWRIRIRASPQGEQLSIFCGTRTSISQDHGPVRASFKCNSTGHLQQIHQYTNTTKPDLKLLKRTSHSSVQRMEY